MSDAEVYLWLYGHGRLERSVIKHEVKLFFKAEFETSGVVHVVIFTNVIKQICIISGPGSNTDVTLIF